MLLNVIGKSESFKENASSQSHEVQGKSSSQSLLVTQQASEVGHDLVVIDSYVNVCYPKAPNIDESGPGGQSLHNG